LKISSDSDANEVIGLNMDYSLYASTQAVLNASFSTALGMVLNIPASYIFVYDFQESMNGGVLLYYNVSCPIVYDSDNIPIQGSAIVEVVAGKICDLFSDVRFIDSLQTASKSSIIDQLNNGFVNFPTIQDGTIEQRNQVLSNALVSLGFPPGMKAYYHQIPFGTTIVSYP
jgi:hypothetical protein